MTTTGPARLPLLPVLGSRVQILEVGECRGLVGRVWGTRHNGFGVDLRDRSGKHVRRVWKGSSLKVVK